MVNHAAFADVILTIHSSSSIISTKRSAWIDLDHLIRFLDESVRGQILF